ncbi:three-Cys-motif partner protein TcmP [Bacteroidota bacterium]
MKRNFDPIVVVENDGLQIHSSHIWSKQKYKLVGGYCNIFTRAMRKEWEILVYVDLYSGPGYTQIVETNRILKTSPLIALSLPNPFDVYIFCDENEQYLDTLQKRVSRDFPDKVTHFIKGNCNNIIEEVKNRIPLHGKGKRVLTFCFADPFDLNLEFKTIEQLSSNKLVDFLILQAYYMDANRNYENYLNDDNNKIAKFLGDNDWRKKFHASDLYPNNFVQFLTNAYDVNMKRLAYLDPLRNSIKLPFKNVKLYYLSFYSKHPRGNDLYKKVQLYADDQFTLGL